MNDNEQELIQRLGAWKVESPSASLADNICRHALQLPQRRSWIFRIAQSLEAAFTQWHYGLSYKLACLALCAALGLSSGEVTPPQEDDLSLVTELAFVDFGDDQ